MERQTLQAKCEQFSLRGEAQPTIKYQRLFRRRYKRQKYRPSSVNSKVMEMQKTIGLFEKIRLSISHEQLEMALLMAYLSNLNRKQKATRLIDIIYVKDFGTGHKVSQKIQTLANQKLIALKADLNDSGIKNILVTNIGYEWLAQLENKISVLELAE